MDEEGLDAIRLSREVIDAQVSFFTWYSDLATTAQIERDAVDDEWVAGAASATSLRFAAQFACLVDPARARGLITSAARQYIRLGVPYGYFLLAMDPGHELDEILLRDAPLWRAPAPRSSDGLGILASSARNNPVQIAYLLLAMAARRTVAAKVGGLLEEFWAQLRVHSTAPMGPQSVPLETYLGIMNALRGPLRSDWNSHDGAVQLIGGIAQLAERYAASIRQAQENRYLWDLGLAPVDVIDLDVVGLATLAFQIWRDAGLDAQSLVHELPKPLGPIARLPISIALDFDHSVMPS